MYKSGTHALAVLVDHLAHQCLKTYTMFPIKLGACLRRIAEQNIHFRRSKIAWIDLDQFLATYLINAGLLRSLAAPLEPAPDPREGALDKLAHGMAGAGCQHVVVRLGLLQHLPHALDVVARV